ncbi:hypothetical protein A8924_6080 [Saccharopolyspora erythraea NRRL 2338]|uniref:Zinc finger protein n=1 Tax=Saccharopolyspora erythraea TaxID=1836 RepID=A0ABN1C5C3_SACER|nr:hypothetical protein [Saccharopolyspora erythraea]EQD85295.1 hypothetical protein N599_15555 [Saccharopolyspora erythraea D]PFG98563.1 hypothetical protein A8924_6080 [Saccharopolyspora erythraea NRRL 2338]QRK88602.1 hypothetical protein JQX30_28755 [Saccharopolyspora erythraea]
MANRHFWQPIQHTTAPGGVRHAFRGRRWEGEPSATTVCGQQVPLARTSEMDWITSPSCPDCTEILRQEC